MTDTTAQRYAFFDGKMVPIEDAKISVMTHAFNYGTGVFEGIRGYWNEEDGEIYVVLVREHFKRFLKNCRMMCIEDSSGLDDLVDIALQVVRRGSFGRMCTSGPLPTSFLPPSTSVLSMEGVSDALTIFAAPMGNYVAIDQVWPVRLLVGPNRRQRHSGARQGDWQLCQQAPPRTRRC